MLGLKVCATTSDKSSLLKTESYVFQTGPEFTSDPSVSTSSMLAVIGVHFQVLGWNLGSYAY